MSKRLFIMQPLGNASTVRDDRGSDVDVGGSGYHKRVAPISKSIETGMS